MIEAIEVTHHRLQLDPPFPAAWDPEPRRGFPVAVVQVYDSSGAVGIGAGDPVRGLIDYEHLFIGSDPLDLDRHSAVLENISFLDGRPWPFDLALWDLAGKINGLPVWKMLGGVDPRIRTYASFGTHRSASATAETAL
ncbi:MAG: mandelate racemase/muconate lactonizing enzyme family protein, partial [Acidimicrobiia bacterium]